MLRFYNSLTRRKEVFKPMSEKKVNMYVCGITVYDSCHLGHARSMVCFDVIARFIRSIGFDLNYVRNITDIDDKIIKRANDLNLSISDITNKYIDEMQDDALSLSINAPDLEPRATNYIDKIIALITRLIDTGYAYVSENGDVCYEVAKFKAYGKLSNKDLDSLISGIRVDVVKEKRSPLDFVLWKQAKDGEPFWSSPWGNGRPGWHIECSAMAMNELGEQFDIHGGGVDLQFPHHENEIAQSEAVSCKPFANYWLHVGMLQVNNEKMAKSTGNFFTIKDVLAKYHSEVIRYFLLSSQYRSPLNYSDENIINAGRALSRLYQTLRDVEINTAEVDESWQKEFNEAMEDDINTPVALSILFKLSHEVNKNKSQVLASTLKHLAAVLGLLEENPQVFLQSWLKNLRFDAREVNSLLKERDKARNDKNWQHADKIRKDLLGAGIELEDTVTGTIWKICV